MKVSIQKEDLQNSLSHIYTITERKSTIPILCNVKLEAEESLKISGINVDMEIIETAKSNVLTAGSTTVAAHTFHDVVRKLPAGVVDLELEKDSLIIRAGKSKFKLPTLPVSDFPVMTLDDVDTTFSLPVENLIKIIDKVKCAISTEETRYFLNGIFLHSTENNGRKVLRGVATDSHRLAKQDVNLPAGAESIEGIIIPRKAILELRRLLEDSSEEVIVKISNTKIKFAFGDIELTSKLIDGKFPDYQKIIPTNTDKILEVDTEKLYTSVDRISSIVSSEKSRGIKIKIAPNLLTFSANNSDSSSGTEELEANYSSDSVIEVSFNSKYIMDAASVIEGKNLRMSLYDNISPAIIEEQNDDSYLHILLPIRLV